MVFTKRIAKNPKWGLNQEGVSCASYLRWGKKSSNKPVTSVSSEYIYRIHLQLGPVYTLFYNNIEAEIL